jgi:DNA-binding LacI/PurR family transcriptional regulator
LRKSERCTTADTPGSDKIALAVLATARELGIQVSEELSPIGMDGHPLEGTFGFTTMNQYPATQAGITVCQALARVSGAWDGTWMRTQGGGGPKNPPAQRPSA